ncbi:PRC-barrel domain-containing protein [Jannaschia formosa]|uniref:PRC-barrel domain-containing protein n=1 Tax=Jannaschia formosa TaxID=2259592 RepID=UPI0014315CD4|nr:PRC-barrel domain-containing protein [Jannaschia formosa]
MSAAAFAASHTDGSETGDATRTFDADVATTGTPPFSTTTIQYGEKYLATTLIGTTVHATEVEFDAMTPLAAGTVAEWDEIGEIGDMIIGVDGTLEAVVIDVGGFLGIGAKEVAVDWAALEGVREEDDPSEWFLVVTITQDALEAAPELERVPAE